MKLRVAACWLSLAVLVIAVPRSAMLEEKSRTAHGLAMHGDLKYGPEFTHFDYVNPDAPKGGTLRRHTTGTFDSFNPFIIKGNPATGAAIIYDTLLAPSGDEPFSQYGALAQSVETPPDRGWVIFTLREAARWHDGVPITVDDVIWTFNTLRAEGEPFYRHYYGTVERVEKLDERRVKFTFKPGENRELPLILGQLVVLPKHYWEGRAFAQGTLEPPLGSGPYKIGRFEPGKYVEYERVADYWGKDLPVNRGRHNFDRLRFEFFRDDTVALEALKGALVDLRLEGSAKNWATQYQMPEVADGRLQHRLIPNQQTEGMQGFAFNTRRNLFKDPRFRQALGYAFDFEWANQALFYGQYKRTRSYFDNSELAARGVPGPRELAILEPYRHKLPAEVFSQEYQPPGSDPGATPRSNLMKAVAILREAGFVIRDGTLRDPDGAPVAFEILLVTPTFERIVLPFIKSLDRLGIAAQVRTIDQSQYVRRIREFDFDVLVANFPQSSSPGNEQREYWGSAAAAQPGSRNWIGIADPVIDELIEKLIAAADRESLVAHTRALDRVLQWGHYVIPQWHIAGDRVAYWNRFGQPEVMPSAGVDLTTWWQARETAEPRSETATAQRSAAEARP